jgi:hypothetical protein
MLFFGSSRVVADGHNSLSTQNWWCASRRLATRQQLVDPHLLGIHISTPFLHHVLYYFIGRDWHSGNPALAVPFPVRDPSPCAKEGA